MKVLIVNDIHVYNYNGRMYVGTQISTILKRYKQAFGDIQVCSRINDVDTLPAGHECVEDLFASFYGVSNLSAAFSLRFSSKIKELLSSSDLLIIRCPTLLGITAARIGRSIGKPYLAEVMGDGWDAYWNHGIAGKIMAPYYHLETKHCVWKANYALYVTEKYLQKRYPCKGISIGASNVLIKETDDDVLSKKIEHYTKERNEPFILMTSASVDVRYKGQEYVIKAIPRLNKEGIKVKYLMCGGGKGVYLRSLVTKLGVEDQVVFTGRLSLEDILKHLDKVDIYIQPSLQEGLPRSVIEAMSRGCHVIGARTAGIPELIDDQYVVRRKSSTDIANKIIAINNLSKKEKINLCNRNYQKSKEYRADLLNNKRNMFFDQIKQSIPFMTAADMCP